MQKTTLIIDKRKELSTKYKKLIENDENIVLISRSLNSAIKLIQDNEPDLIIISDSIEEKLSDFCKKLRILTYNMRPAIVAVSKSAETEDKINALENGADDFLSEPINSEEFKTRIKAHLRREHESNINLKTMLPNKNYSLKALKRIISKDSKWACLLISVQNFENYKEIYSELASDKLIQTYCAIIKSALEKEDYFGHFSENEFLIITHPIRAEKIASYLTFAFDSISQKFYSTQDVNRGYTILQGDELAGRRSDFVFSTIGITSNEFKKYTDVKQIINSLLQVHNLAKKPYGSSYAVERPKISAQNAVLDKNFNNKIWVMEEDEALSFLLATNLDLEGYETQLLKNPQAMRTLLSTDITVDTPPAVIIIDAGDIETLSGLNICKYLKENTKFKNSKIIITSVLHDKELVLNTGAELYIPKPYQLSSLMKWVKIFISEFND
ncbi:MAG TPA: response regulator [Candidatus Gastranaerophilaceae bacterium]|nr:response regulator [Candidatus Gastranaerophilaceae bacterium]